METADLLCDLIRQHRVVELQSAKDPEGEHRIVEPHAVYIGSNDRGFVDFWQLSGWSWSRAPAGWRRLALTDIVSVRPTDRTFVPRPDYHPWNRKFYRAFVCAAEPARLAEEMPG